MPARGFKVAIETNGTIAPAPAGIDWICVSPKAGAPLKLISGHELKLVVPLPRLEPETLGTLDFQRFSVQAMDDAGGTANMAHAIALCLRRPRWYLSVQTHKVIGVR